MKYYFITKVITTAMLFAVFACFGYDVPDLTTNVVVIRDAHGKSVRQTETTYRADAPIMVVGSRLNSLGEMVVDYRIYLLGTNVFLFEGKNDAGLNVFALFHLDTTSNTATGGSEIEMFVRQPDGTVTPAKTAEIKDYQQACKASIIGFTVMQPRRDIKTVVISPDKTFKAVLFEKSSGVTDSYNRQVGIETNSMAIWNNENCASFFCVTADGVAAKYLAEIEVNWASTNTLRIKYPFSPGLHGPHIIRTNTPPEAVFIEYQGFEVR